jgi:RNA polymerase sigma factor (TIGR02999 family)
LLRAWNDGDEDARDALVPMVYAELHRLARLYMSRERQGQTLQPTALVHEAYLRLIDIRRVRWQDRAHFFAVSGQIMRRILVDHARARHRDKRGGGAPVLVLNEEIDMPEQRSFELIALDDALDTLAKLDPQQSRVVELRFFAGLSIDETAEALNVSRATVNRDWVTARAWLVRELTRNPDSEME